MATTSLETDVSQCSFDSGISLSPGTDPNSYNYNNYAVQSCQYFPDNQQQYGYNADATMATYYDNGNYNQDGINNVDASYTTDGWTGDMLSVLNDAQNQLDISAFGFEPETQQQNETDLFHQLQNVQAPICGNPQDMNMNCDYTWADPNATAAMFNFDAPTTQEPTAHPIPEMPTNSVAEKAAKSSPTKQRKKRGRKASKNAQATSEGGVEKRKRKRIITHIQRQAANVRERKRMVTLNEAFEGLKKKIPLFNYENKLSRIETLKLSIVYICFMQELLMGTPLNTIKLTQFLEPIPLSVSRKTLPEVYL